jgi:hypothetical protein
MRVRQLSMFLKHLTSRVLRYVYAAIPAQGEEAGRRQPVAGSQGRPDGVVAVRVVGAARE